MPDPDASLPLQKAVLERLKTFGELAMIGGRVLDNPAPGTVKPYVSFGPSTVTPDLAQLYRGQSERFQVDAWSAGPGRAEAKAIARGIVAALHDFAITIPGHRCIYLQHEQTQHVPEPDGVTQHAACIFTAATEPAG